MKTHSQTIMAGYIMDLTGKLNVSRIQYIAMAVALALGGCSSNNEVTRLQAIERTKHETRSDAGRVSTNEAGSAIIRPGDQVQIAVWGYPEFNTTASVKEEGMIVVPLVGEMQAARSTKEEFTKLLKKRLGEYIKEDVNITVSVVSMAGRRVNVMGAVNKQDNYPVVGDVSLVEILTTAGGATTEADLGHVKIYRNGISTNAIDVDLSRHMERGDIDATPRVRPGDTVFVPRQENLVRGLSDFVRDALLVFGFFRVLN